jgi:hypothetical protein
VSTQQLQGQLQEEHNANDIKYTTGKQSHKDNSHEVSLGSSILGKLLFLPQTTMQIIRTIGAKKKKSSTNNSEKISRSNS